MLRFCLIYDLMFQTVSRGIFRGFNRIDLCQHCCCSHSANCGWVNLNWSVRWWVIPTFVFAQLERTFGQVLRIISSYIHSIRSLAVDRRNNTQVYMFSFALLAYQWHLNSCVVSPGKRLKTDFKWFILRLIHSRHVNPSIRILATCWKDSTGGFNSTASRSSLPAICKACVCDSDSFGSVLCG